MNAYTANVSGAAMNRRKISYGHSVMASCSLFIVLLPDDSQEQWKYMAPSGIIKRHSRELPSSSQTQSVVSPLL